MFKIYQPSKQVIHQKKTSLQWGQNQQKLGYLWAGLGLKVVELSSPETLIQGEADINQSKGRLLCRLQSTELNQHMSYVVEVYIDSQREQKKLMEDSALLSHY